MPARIEVEVNGERLEVPEGTTVSDLLELLRTKREGVAVERNRVLVRRSELEGVRLERGDRIEVVTLVAGG